LVSERRIKYLKIYASALNRVNTERNKGITAFGIVDRDALMKEEKWELWWETDDQQFKQAKPFGNYILVLQRWELENYLLSPEELEIVLYDKELRSPKKIDVVIKDLLKKAEDLKVLSAAMILSNENGYRFPKSFGSKNGKVGTGEVLQNNVESHLSKHIQFNQSNQQFTTYIQKIEAFAEGNTEPTKQRWERLNRLLDGKLTLQRLDLSNERGYLATHIRIKNHIDPELMTYIEELKPV
jgi:hypothetical protein